MDGDSRNSSSKSDASAVRSLRRKRPLVSGIARAWPVKNSVDGPETAQNATIAPPLLVRSDSFARVIRCGPTRRNDGMGARLQFKRRLAMSAGRLRFAHIFVCVAWGVFPNGVTGAMTAWCGGIVYLPNKPYLVRLRALMRRLRRDLYFAVRSLIFTAADVEAR